MHGREALVPQDASHFAVDVEDRGRGVVEQRFRCEMRFAHLLQQLAHVLRACAGRRLVGHTRHPLHQIALQQARDRHHHQAHRAIAADVVLRPPDQRRVDDVAVHGIEDDHGVIGHA